MDNSSHIKRHFDDLCDKHDIKMCTIYNERTGSILFKTRFIVDKNGQDGGGTRNSNMHFRRKSDKMFQREADRAQDRNKNNPPSSRTRSKTESLRQDTSPLAHDLGNAVHFNLFEVASPVTCHNSMYEEQFTVPTESPDPMPTDVNMLCSDAQSEDQTSHRVDSKPADVTFPDILEVDFRDTFSFSNSSSVIQQLESSMQQLETEIGESSTRMQTVFKS